MFFTDRYNLQRYNFNPGTLQHCCEDKPTAKIGYFHKNNTLVFYCGDSACDCHKTVTTQFVIAEIVENLKRKESETWLPYLQIVEYYNISIKSLEHERDQLLRKVQSEEPPRLCEDEINLLKYLDEGVSCYIPKHDWERGVREMLGENQGDRIGKQLVEVEKNFIDLALKLRRLWEQHDTISSFSDFMESRQGMKERIFEDELKTNTSLKSVKVNGKTKKPCNVVKAEFEKVTGLCVQQTNIKTISEFLISCPNLEQYEEVFKPLSLTTRIIDSNTCFNYEVILTLSKFERLQKIALNLESAAVDQTMRLLSERFPLLSDLEIRTLNLRLDTLDILSQNQEKIKKLSLICSLTNPFPGLFKPLHRFENIHSLNLNIHNYRITVQQLNFEAFQKLETLQITLVQRNSSYMSNGDIYQSISKAKSLKQLVIEDAVDEGTMKAWAKGCTRLQKLKMAVLENHFGYIGKIKTLKSITLGGGWSGETHINSVKNQDMLNLCKDLQSLQYLEIVMSPRATLQAQFDQIGVSHICKYNPLMKTLILNNQSIGNRGAMLIGLHLHRLEKLQLKSCGIENSGFAYLSKLKNLVDLQIGERERRAPKINNRGSKFRFNLPNLTSFKFLSFAFQFTYTPSSIHDFPQITRSLKNQLVFQFNSNINSQEVDGVPTKSKIWLEMGKETLELNNHIRMY